MCYKPPPPDPSISIPPCLILLNGFPGVGKLTIAKNLCQAIPAHHLLDNHQIIDRAEAIEPGRGPAHQKLRNQYRGEEFVELKSRPEEELVIIMTACLENLSEHYDQIWEEYFELAKGRGVPFVMISLTCDEEVNVQRLESEERRCGAKLKLIDGGILKDIRRDLRMLDPKEMSGGILKLPGVHHYRMDTTRLTAKESADEIRGILVGIVKR